MRHVTCGHAGRKIDEHARVLFHALGRGICTNTSCQCLRPLSSIQCHRCARSEPARPITTEDSIPRRDASTNEEPPPDPPSAQDPLIHPLFDDALPDAPDTPGNLPDDFLPRVRNLLASTIVHIPIQFRAKLCEITASTLHDLVEGLQRGGMLEEGRSKLLLFPIPRHISSFALNLQNVWDFGIEAIS